MRHMLSKYTPKSAVGAVGTIDNMYLSLKEGPSQFKARMLDMIKELMQDSSLSEKMRSGFNAIKPEVLAEVWDLLFDTIVPDLCCMADPELRKNITVLGFPDMLAAPAPPPAPEAPKQGFKRRVV